MNAETWYKSLPFHSVLFPLNPWGSRVVAAFFPLRGCGAYWGQIQFTHWAKARVHPGWLASSSQDPYWWQWLPYKLPTAHQEQLWILPVKDTLTFWSPVHQLQPLSYSRPSLNHHLLEHFFFILSFSLPQMIDWLNWFVSAPAPLLRNDCYHCSSQFPSSKQ